jgi:hypothetical protein
VILYRCFRRRRRAAPAAPGGALWFARALQGEGRHDRPELYGCLYASEEPVSAVVEQLAALAGTALGTPDLVRGGLPLALATLRLEDGAELVDLDDPAVLAELRLRPALVATHERARTQAGAAAVHAQRPGAAGLRWWSLFEAQWANVTLFDRAAPSLEVEEVRTLALGDQVVQEAAGFLGLPRAA